MPFLRNQSGKHPHFGYFSWNHNIGLIYKVSEEECAKVTFSKMTAIK